MANNLQCEFSLIRYVPDVVKGEFANIGVLLREAGSESAEVKFTRDWSRVRCIDPNADTEMLESLETEIAARLASGVDVKVNTKPILETLHTTVQSTRQDTTLAQQDKMDKIKAARETANTAINAVLTPDQQAKFAQMQQNMRNHRHGGGGAGGGESPAATSSPATSGS